VSVQSEAIERGVWVDIVWHILEIPDGLSEATARALTEQIVDAVMEQTQADREHIATLKAGHETVTITHWRVVNSANGGISFSASSRDSSAARAQERAEEWAATLRGYDHDVHLEVWEQSYEATPDVWRRVS
jgi:hypothetical protein